MRIAIRFSPAKGAQSGSQNTIAKELIPELYKLHRDLILFSSNPEAFKDVQGLQIYPTRPLGMSRSMKGALFERIADQLTFEKELKKMKCDVVYYPYTHEALLFTINVPQVITVHDLIPLLFPEHYPLMSIQWKLFTIPSLKFAKKIISVSHNTKIDIIRITGITEDKIDVVSNGFRSMSTAAKTVASSNSYGRYLLYVSSSQYPHKNLLNLLKAFDEIIDAVPHNLIIVGKSAPRFRDEVHKTIQQLDLKDRLHILEDVTAEELCALYRHAELFVYPSLYEGFGIPLLEAMSCNVPIVASNAASIPEVCGDAAHYFDANSPEAIAKAIMTGLTSQNMRQTLVAKANSRIKDFGWEITARRVLDICKAATQ